MGLFERLFERKKKKTDAVIEETDEVIDEIQNGTSATQEQIQLTNQLVDNMNKSDGKQLLEDSKNAIAKKGVEAFQEHQQQKKSGNTTLSQDTLELIEQGRKIEREKRAKKIQSLSSNYIKECSSFCFDYQSQMMYYFQSNYSKKDYQNYPNGPFLKLRRETAWRTLYNNCPTKESIDEMTIPYCIFCKGVHYENRVTEYNEMYSKYKEMPIKDKLQIIVSTLGKAISWHLIQDKTEIENLVDLFPVELEEYKYRDKIQQALEKIIDAREEKENPTTSTKNEQKKQTVAPEDLLQFLNSSRAIPNITNNEIQKSIDNAVETVISQFVKSKKAEPQSLGSITGRDCFETGKAASIEEINQAQQFLDRQKNLERQQKSNDETIK